MKERARGMNRPHWNAPIGAFGTLTAEVFEATYSWPDAAWVVVVPDWEGPR